MFALIARFFQTLRTTRQADGDVAHGLMESAEARAGLDPRAARELRGAAQAYLRVVR